MKTIIFDFYKTLYDPKKEYLYEGVVELLLILSNKYRLILMSTGGIERLNVIRKLNIRRYFLKTLIVKRKTIDYFNEVIFDPNQTLIIGDRIEEEIRIGKKLGCKTLRVNPDTENPVITIQRNLHSSI